MTYQQSVIKNDPEYRGTLTDPNSDIAALHHWLEVLGEDDRKFDKLLVEEFTETLDYEA